MNSNNKDSLPNPLALDHSQSSVVKLEEYYENIGDNQEPNNSDKENFEVDPEREEMENDYELMKNLNSLKERNQKLESINKYQSIKIESLESELEKTLAKLKIKEAEIEDMKNSNNNQGKSSQNRTASYIAQINNLNLQRVELTVLDSNIRAQHLYEKCGFVKEGTLRKYAYKNGEFVDMHMYSILKNEYLEQIFSGGNFFYYLLSPRELCAA